jgi:DNA repair photolyase
MSDSIHRPIKGRGALDNPDNRFESLSREPIDDGWGSLEAPENPSVELIRDSSRTIIARNQSPDVPFDQSINPYRGCEHGCIYCFARPTHAYLGYSAGLDFETRLLYKPDAAKLLRAELGRKSYRCAPIGLGTNTDAYQPLERRLGITRQLLEVFLELRHPVSVLTKSSLIERDLDLLAQLAENNLVRVVISLTTLDRELSRLLEPRAASPQRRLEVIRNLTEAGISTTILMAPVIPFLNDQEIEDLLGRARDAGAEKAGYVLLRLPHEVEGLFSDWLDAHYPEKAQRILNRIRDSRGGRAYDSRFGSRMKGEGVFADLIQRRFHKACNMVGFPGTTELDCSGFRKPATSAQMKLFD